MTAPTFEFSTASYPTEFTVVSFIGNERMSRLFQYRIELKMPHSIDVDEETLIDESATFSFVRPSMEVAVNGILASFEYLRSGANYDYYRATLVPEAWRESLGVDFEIFIEMTPKDIIDEELGDAGLNADTSGITFPGPVRDFTCQYNESNFAFVSRIAEHNGYYYYFDHAQSSAMIFADDLQYPACETPDIDFDASASGASYYERVSAFRKTVNNTATYVRVRDNNPSQPSQNIVGDMGTESGSGHAINLVGENVADSDEAAYIAQIRFEEIQNQKTVYEGESGAIQLRPGFTFNLDGHRRNKFNDSFLVVGIVHEGNNLDEALTQQDGEFPYYKNTFRAIPASLQFRPGKVTPVPQAISTQGRVYSEAGNPKRAERDLQGNYRVRFNFLDDEIKERASYWLRMGQAAAGAEDTLDIPLKGGVEVQVGFENGNPDKPFIQSAMPNAEFPAHVTANNPNNALIATSGLLGLKANGGFYRRVQIDQDEWDDDNRVFGEEDFALPVMMNGGTNAVTIGADMSEEVEMGGKYVVDRRYGDAYIWIDGNTYKWDNEKNYSFGNDYEEIHEDEDGIGNGEVFSMEAQMQSIGTTFSDKDYSEWEDGGDGLIEKNWGDKCEYHEGRAFAWSGGNGPGGSLETFSYGNGYTENLLESSQGTSADLPSSQKEHADDWESDSKIDPSIATIEKTFGATYSYQNGYSLDIKVGDASSKTYGDSTSEVHGDSVETVHGNADNKVMGATNDMFLGAKNEMEISAANAMKLSVYTDITLGAALEMFLGGKIEIGGGPGLELEISKTGISVVDMDARVSKIEAKTNKLDAVTSDIKLCANKINTLINEVDSSAISIQTGGLTMIS